jgi:3-hydroxyacyl-[acyl-carrier-protein] dehydratase
MIGPAGIKRLIPHRHPLLLLDHVIAAAPTSVLAVKAITTSEFWYRSVRDDADHFYPWALVLESWCQAAGVLVCLGQPNADVRTASVPLFGAVSGVRFGRPAVPGDLLWHRVRLLRATASAAVIAGESSARGETLLQVDRAVVAFRPAATLIPHMSNQESPHGS